MYPDTWSGPRVTYTRTHCSRGRLAVNLESDPSLFSQTQTVTAFEAGRRVGRARIAPAGTATMTVPLRASSGTCIVEFVVALTKVPGAGDERRLGAHFLSFTLMP